MKFPHKLQEDAPSTRLPSALLELVLRPHTTLIPAWSWKAALLSTFFRSALFFVTNLKAGGHKAIEAFLVEAAFAIFATGLLGAVSQRLRFARPFWATAIVVWLAMPAVSTIAQFAVHRAAKTPHLGAGIPLTFALAALASSYTWYAMKNGALLGGSNQPPSATTSKPYPA